MSADRLIWIALAAVVALSGCPVDFVIPPFDATGQYEGQWESTVSWSSNPIRCAAKLTLEQDLNAAFPSDHNVSGTLTLNLTCPRAYALLVSRGFPAVITIEISGVQTAKGEIVFASGNCVEMDCEGVVVSAVGTDTDDDGFMDEIEATWTFGTVLDLDISAMGGTLTATRVP